MSDYISRQAAINAILAQSTHESVRELYEYTQEHPTAHWTKGLCDAIDAVIAVDGASSVQSEPQWIPCSERLPDHPENDDYYLVTIQCEHYDGWDDYVTGFAEWTKHGWDELSCYIGQIKVVAWMPLPEPYKEGKQDDSISD